MANLKPPEGAREYGFTLMEVLVALVIASIALSWFFYLLSDTLDRRVRLINQAALEDEILKAYTLYVLTSPERKAALKQGEEVRVAKGGLVFVFNAKRFDPLAEEGALEIIPPEGWPSFEDVLKGLKEGALAVSYVRGEVYKEDAEEKPPLAHLILPPP